jgi:hypothetical protein
MRRCCCLTCREDVSNREKIKSRRVILHGGFFVDVVEEDAIRENGVPGDYPRVR